MKWIIGEPSQENVYTYSYWKKYEMDHWWTQSRKCIYLFLLRKKYEMDHWWTQSRKCIYLFLLKKKWNGSLVNPVKKNVYTYSYWEKKWNGSMVNPVKKMYIPIPTEKNMKWIIGEPSQENVYTYSYWKKYEMDHWWTQSRKCIYLFLLKKIWNGSLVNSYQSRKCIYLFLLKKIWNGSLVNPVKKMYIPIPTEIKYEMDHWWTQSRKCIYLFLLKKKWKSMVKIKKMYIPMKWIIGEPSQENVYTYSYWNKIWNGYEPSQENIYTYSYWNKIWNGSLVNPVKKMYIPIPTKIKYEMDHWWTQSRKCIYLFLLK